MNSEGNGFPGPRALRLPGRLLQQAQCAPTALWGTAPVLAHKPAGNATALGAHERHSWKASPSFCWDWDVRCELGRHWPARIRLRRLWVPQHDCSNVCGIHSALWQAPSVHLVMERRQTLREVDAADKGPQVPHTFPWKPASAF